METGVLLNGSVHTTANQLSRHHLMRTHIVQNILSDQLNLTMHILINLNQWNIYLFFSFNYTFHVRNFPFFGKNIKLIITDLYTHNWTIWTWYRTWNRDELKLEIVNSILHPKSAPFDIILYIVHIINYIYDQYI